MRVVQVVGARPQFIKYHAVAKALEGLDEITDVLVHTGQHYDYAMSEVFFRDLGIRPPDHHLGVGSGSQGAQTGEILRAVEAVLLRERPQAVVVYGDTNTTLGAALAASKLHLPVVHVESGLRSFDKRMPEEINRVLTDHVSALLLCPTEMAVRNLLAEGFRNAENRVELVPETCTVDGLEVDSSHPLALNVGDVMYDVLLEIRDTAAERSRILEELSLCPQSYAVMTLHRAANTDDVTRCGEILEFVSRATRGMEVIFPVHPRTRRFLAATSLNLGKNVRVIEPLGYLDMVRLVGGASLMLTDSGGLQKECYWLGVPCITLREETEWVETIQAGWNVLYKNYSGEHSQRDCRSRFYGDGRAAHRIVRAIWGAFS